MFDSSKQQPDQGSTIDFLHNGESLGSKASSPKKHEHVELAHMEQTSQEPEMKKFSGRLFNSLTSSFRSIFRSKSDKEVPRVLASHNEPSFVSSGVKKPASSDDRSIPTSVERRNDKERVSSEVRTPLKQHENAQSETAAVVKGKPIEKISLDKFRDKDRDVSTPSGMNFAKSGKIGVSFHKDRDPGDGELDVNLLPEQRHVVSSRTKRVVVVICLSLEFIALLVGFLAVQAKADGRLLGLREVESQQTLLDIQVKRYREVVKEATNLQQQALMLKGILEKRPDLTGIFAWFESHTIDSVYYENVAFADNGEVHVHVLTPSVVDASYQMNIFDATKSWKKITISNISLGEKKEGMFNVEFDVDLGGFVKEEEKETTQK